MKQNFKSLFLSLFALSAVAHANVDNAQMRNLENRVNALEQRRGANGVINPPARPQVRNGADLFVTADLLLWEARENGLGLGILSQSEESDEFISNGKVRNIHPDWNVGVRVGLGYNMPHDGWDLSLTWLRFYTSGHRKAFTNSEEILLPTFIHPASNFAGSGCGKINGHWRMHLNQVDLDMGREFFVSKWLTIRPHFGVRTDWLSQKLKVAYKDFNVQGSPDTTVLGKDNWWGLGLEGGLDTQWGLGSGWSIYGNIAAAILYGKHSYKTDETVKPHQSSLPDNNKFLEVKNGYRVAHPVLDLQLGIRWDHMFCNDRFHFSLQTGWEQHIYFSQNQMMYFTDDVAWGVFVSNQGDLTLQGWTLSARFDF